MTLAELLVVVVILGLLSVVVLPVLNGRSGKRQLVDAAEAISVHLGQQASRALGSHSGAAAWYEAETSGSGSGSAVVALRSGRPRSGVSGSTTVAPLAIPGAATVALACSTSVLPAPIEFAGIPAVFTAETTTRIQLADAGTNRNTANLAFPGGQADPTARMSIPYTLRLPPQRRMSSAVGFLNNDTCIDLSGSTIGVHGFSPNVTTMSDAKVVAIEFDRCGRPVAAWQQHSSPAATPWERTALAPSTPVALLVGLRSQVGAAYVSNSTADEPGVNWQNPQARWVVVDPRTSLVKVVEIPANAISPEASQAMVVQALRGI
jgi:type II secretory pathway pseudopilin PulG